MKALILFVFMHLFFFSNGQSQKIGATFVHQELDLEDFSYGNGFGVFTSFEISRNVDLGCAFSYSTSPYKNFSATNFLYVGNFFFAGNFINTSKIKSNIGLSLEYGKIGIFGQKPYAKKIGAGLRANTTFKNLFNSPLNLELIIQPHVFLSSGDVYDAPNWYWNELPGIFEIQTGITYNLWEANKKE